VVPKLDSTAGVAAVAEALGQVGLGDVPVMAGIETVAGVVRVDDVLQPPVRLAYFGAEDFIADIGGMRTEEGTEVLYARSRVALAARMAGVHAFDQIVPTFSDDERFLADARQGRAIGYRGKMCIHPAQVPLANEVFAPSDEDRDRARRLLTAYEQAAEAGKGAIVFEGQMVDEPMARHARALLEEDDER
jgi:citrate lyase subunit beta/citryl-CoA lyase